MPYPRAILFSLHFIEINSLWNLQGCFTVQLSRYFINYAVELYLFATAYPVYHAFCYMSTRSFWKIIIFFFRFCCFISSDIYLTTFVEQSQVLFFYFSQLFYTDFSCNHSFYVEWKLIITYLKMLVK